MIQCDGRRVQKPTVGQSYDLARSLGLCHPPDIFDSVWLALTALSTDVVREVAIVSDGREVVRTDPFMSEAVILDPCTDDGGEGKPDKVEVALYDGEVGERGGRESHEEGYLSAVANL